MSETPSPGDDSPLYGETWVYESIVGAIPGLDLSDRTALVLQFVLFEALAVAVVAVFDRWQALAPGTAAILVATAGSAFMLDIGQRLRNASIPAVYRQLLFSTSFEVVLGVVGYATVLTVVFVYQPRHGQTLLETTLGPSVPLIAAFLFFMILWDIAYRVGTGWWIALLALWRAYATGVDPATAATIRAIDLRAAAFGLSQLLLLPFVWEFRLLTALLLGHVAAVLVVVAAARLRTGSQLD